MGVRGLVSFIRSHLSSSEYVSLKSSISSKRIIVVDGSAFLYWFFYKQSTTPFCMIDYADLDLKLENLLHLFLSLNIQLIFVFDGPAEARKIYVKVNRVHQHAFNMNNHSENGGPFPSCPTSYLAIESLSRVILRLQTMSDAHEIIWATGEADRLIAECALSLNAIGILSNDSDMIVFFYPSTVDVPLFPLWSLDFSLDGDILVHRVAATKVSSAIGVAPQYMWVLASLLGHDMTPPDLFHSIQTMMKQATADDRASTQKKTKAKKKKKKKMLFSSDPLNLSDSDSSHPPPISIGSSETQSLSSPLPIPVPLVPTEEILLGIIGSNGNLSCGLTSQQSIQLAVQVIRDSCGGVINTGENHHALIARLVAHLLSVTMEEVEAAISCTPCVGRCVSQAPLISKVRTHPVRDSWDTQLSPPQPLQSRWSWCCSKTAHKCRTLYRYFEETRLQYRIEVRGSERRASEETSGDRMPRDMQLVRQSATYLPTVPWCENLPAHLYKCLDEDARGYAYPLDRLAKMREVVYNMLLCTSDSCHGNVAEILFQDGSPYFRSVSLSPPLCPAGSSQYLPMINLILDKGGGAEGPRDVNPIHWDVCNMFINQMAIVVKILDVISPVEVWHVDRTVLSFALSTLLSYVLKNFCRDLLAPCDSGGRQLGRDKIDYTLDSPSVSVSVIFSSIEIAIMHSDYLTKVCCQLSSDAFPPALSAGFPVEHLTSRLFRTFRSSFEVIFQKDIVVVHSTGIHQKLREWISHNLETYYHPSLKRTIGAEKYGVLISLCLDHTMRLFDILKEVCGINK